MRSLSLLIVGGLCVMALATLAAGDADRRPLDLPSGGLAFEDPEAVAPVTIQFFDRRYTADTFIFCLNTSQAMITANAWAVQQLEVIETIRTLPIDARFNIVAYGGDAITRWRPSVKPSNAVNRFAAVTWIEDLSPSGDTHLAEGLLAAIQDANSVESDSKQIILCGRASVAPNLVSQVQATNSHETRINTIHVGFAGDPVSVFAEVSNVTDGQHTQIIVNTGGC